MVVIDRALALDVVRDAIAACDPATRVADALRADPLPIGPIVGVAIGKAAVAMARGAGAVARGIAVAPDGVADPSRPLPAGWTAMVGDHPFVGARSLAAGAAVMELVRGARTGDVVLVLVSGGASALCEVPRAGVTLAVQRARVVEVMASGAPIAELNRARGDMSELKAGGLARACAVPIVTLAISDVAGDDLAVIGSGPTVPVRAGDRARVIAPMKAFALAAHAALARRGVIAAIEDAPRTGDVDAVANALALASRPLIAWGEPTVVVPAVHGEGGRAQQLALALARRFAGTRASALVVGSDGIDGPPPAHRSAPAGAFVDGASWAGLAAAGIDGDAALAHRDAGSALAAIGALIVTGPTGINHADLVVLA